MFKKNGKIRLSNDLENTFGKNSYQNNSADIDFEKKYEKNLDPKKLFPDNKNIDQILFNLGEDHKKESILSPAFERNLSHYTDRNIVTLELQIIYFNLINNLKYEK